MLGRYEIGALTEREPMMKSTTVASGSTDDSCPDCGLVWPYHSKACGFNGVVFPAPRWQPAPAETSPRYAVSAWRPV